MVVLDVKAFIGKVKTHTTYLEATEHINIAAFIHLQSGIGMGWARRKREERREKLKGAGQAPDQSTRVRQTPTSAETAGPTAICCTECCPTRMNCRVSPHCALM